MSVSNYSDVSGFPVDDEKRERLYDAQTECCVMWTNREGWPVGVMHRFVWHDRRFWVTCTEQRKRVAALRARPQSCIVISSEGTVLGSDINVAAKTVATVHADRETKAWFYPALAARQRRFHLDQVQTYVDRLDTPDRVVIELDPVQFISYDGNKLDAALGGVAYDPAARKESRNLR